MKLKIHGDLSYFWQWDLNRKLVVDDGGVCSQVHFCNGSGEALVCTVRTENGIRVADVPNVLLQKAEPVKAYLYTDAEDGTRTRSLHRFEVLARSKPEAYIYTETEVLNYHSLAERIDQIEQNGVSDERIGEAVAEYLDGQNLGKLFDVDWMATKEETGDNTVYIPEQKASGLWNNLQASLKVGSVYDVTINGEVYVCTAVEDDGILILGNNPSLTLNDYPFCITWAGAGATAGMFFKNSNVISSPVTLKVTGHYEVVYNQLPEEYLPDSVASVSSAGVGQVLAVKEVDAKGKPTAWKAVDMPTGGGGTVEVDTSLTQSGKAADAKAVGDKIAEITGVSLVEPAEDDIPKVFFGGALQPNKNEKVVPFRYISKTQDFSGYAEIKAQGNTSLTYPKKNQTVKMFKDADCTEKLKVDFKGWGKQNKHVYKANWIDLTHARNVVSARLWGDVVKSRANYAELPELLRTSPNHGAVDGFPVKVYAAGVYQGRYTLNIPKDKWTYNMDDDLEEHCVLYSENYVSGCFRALANINGSDWTDEIHDTVPASVKTRWNEVISFVMNSTDEEFKANLSQYFYVDSLLDYYLFCLASCGLDAFGKNQIYMTYDGQRWIASAYDMDSTWGLYWNGSKFVATNYARTSYEDYVHTDGNLLYNRLEQLFWAELQARWAELKNGALTIENIINHFERFTDITPLDLVKEDYASTTGGGSFVNIPSKDTNNIQQIRSFALARLAWTDTYVKGLTQVIPVPCEGITLNKATLTFTAEGTQTLTATVIPDGCTDAVTWESNNTNVATVADGVVAAVANGSAVITAKCGKYSASCSVSVTGIFEPIPCTGISLDTTAHSFTAVGASKTLIATATPADTTDSILWESSNNAVATVAGGVVTSVGDGDCVITAKCGNYSATCNVSVSVSVDPVLPTDSILYELAEATTFDGVDDYVDTGVTLFDTNKDFTVCIDFAPSGSNVENATIFHSVRESSGYPGLSLEHFGSRVSFTDSSKHYFSPTLGLNYTNTTRTRVVFVKDSNAGTLTAYGKNAKATSNPVTFTASTATFNQNALLGAYQTTNGTKGRFWSGTIYGCTIFSRCLTADEIAAFCV